MVRLWKPPSPVPRNHIKQISIYSSFAQDCNSIQAQSFTLRTKWEAILQNHRQIPIELIEDGNAEPRFPVSGNFLRQLDIIVMTVMLQIRKEQMLGPVCQCPTVAGRNCSSIKGVGYTQMKWASWILLLESRGREVYSKESVSWNYYCIYGEA
jgi:hypothetical protein